MLNIILFGAPGCGKGTQAARIKEKYNINHISTGDVIRGEISRGTELGKSMQSYIESGALAPDSIVIGMIRNYMAEHKDAVGNIFDGFPRPTPQAEALKKMLDERGEKISAMINLEVSEDILMARLLRRATLEGRADDNEETIKKRFAVYHNQTAPLIEWFKGEGVFKGFTYTDEIGLEGMVKNITEYVNTII